jgi:general stress protein 26
MAHTLTGTDAATKLSELVREIRVAMFTTFGRAGATHCHPMYLQQADADGDLWFATAATSTVATDVAANPRVLLSFADIAHHRYIAVRGTATVHHDADKIIALWNPGLRVWFPDGPNDPGLMLVRVAAADAEYWEEPAAPVRWLSFAKAVATGQRPEGGEHATLQLDRAH